MAKTLIHPIEVFMATPAHAAKVLILGDSLGAMAWQSSQAGMLQKSARTSIY